MNQIQQLINQMCPNGVEWKTLGEVGTFFNGVTGKSKKDFENGNAKFISYMNVFSNPKLKIDVEDTILINKGEKQNTLQYGDVIFTTSSETSDESGMASVLTIHTDEKLYLNSFCFGFRFNNLEIISPDFYSYIFRSEPLRNQIIKCANGVTRFNISKASFVKVKIPVPPLAIQTRIVEILDHFTNLTANLTAELNLRRKQFEHYREKLLSLDGVEGVEWKKLGEVFDTRNGYTPSKANSKFWKDGNIPWFRMEDIRDKGRFLSDSYLHITESAIKGKGLFKANSFILATTATIGEHALLIADSLANQRFTNLQIRKSLSDKLDVMFMYYYMFVVDDFCKSHTNKSGFASVDMGALKKMPIPLPPLAVQHSIVSILDKFTALIENIEKELVLRQKQYEYYREELLRFGG